MSTGLRVRRATVADAPVLARLVADLGADRTPGDLVARLRSLPEGHTVIVAERGAGVVGFVHVALDPSLLVEARAQVAATAVVPEHRGSGVGARLLDEAATWAREHGCHHLWVRADADLEHAHEFYRATGFDEVEDQLVLRRAVEGTVDPLSNGDGATVVPVVVRTTPDV